MSGRKRSKIPKAGLTIDEEALWDHAARTMAPMGRAQAIVVDPATGVMVGGSDARGEGAAVGW